MALNEKLGDVFIYDDFISLAVPATRQNQQLIAVLQVPLSHALSHFSHLNVQLFILALVFSLLAGIAALFLARSVTRPVTLLATIARRIVEAHFPESIRSDVLAAVGRGEMYSGDVVKAVFPDFREEVSKAAAPGCGPWP